MRATGVRHIFGGSEPLAQTQNLHALIMWPAAFGGYRANDADTLISEVLGIKSRVLLPSLHYSTLRQFVVRVYAGEDFIGTEDDGFRFSVDKSNGVWRPSDRAQVLAVEAEPDRILEVKDEVRRLCGIGRHALHTTDTVEEFRHVWETTLALQRTGLQLEGIQLR